jgi:hypothetical protein
MTEEVIEAELVEEEVPSKLSMTSIGGLTIRKPQDKLPYLNMMIYGDSGAGKTLLAGTAAFVQELSPVLFVDVEGGTLTLGQFDSTADIDVVRMNEWRSVQKVYNELFSGRHPYKTVVIDSLTEMQKFAMNTVLGAGREIDAIGYMPEFKEWHINTEQLRRLVRAFRDLPVNTIFTALAMDVPDPRTAKTENPLILKKPDFTKKLAAEIPAFFDVLFYLYVRASGQKNVRFIQTDKDNRIVAKCRVRGLPIIIENPDMERLYDMLIRNPGKYKELETTDSRPASGMKRKPR